MKTYINHELSWNMKFFSRREQSWLWKAKNFSKKGVGIDAIFVVRFADPATARSFIEVIENSQVYFDPLSMS